MPTAVALELWVKAGDPVYVLGCGFTYVTIRPSLFLPSVHLGD